jgi:hypothetical protein
LNGSTRGKKDPSPRNPPEANGGISFSFFYSCGKMQLLMILSRLLSLIPALALATSSIAAEIKIGIIGTDTSHAIAFTDSLNNPKSKNHVPGGKVVAAYKGGSADIPSSADRVEGYAKRLKEEFGVQFYDTIEEMCKHVDAILLESVDGRPHLEQARPVIKAGKPMYIDKPMAASLKDVLEIFRLANAAKVPVFSCSSLRYGKDTQAVRKGSIGKVTYAETFSPCETEPNHPELFWYGIHGVESLFTVMGTGCESVQRLTAEDGSIEVIGTWQGGRKGIYRQKKGYGGLARGEKGEAKVGSFDGYAPMLVEVIKFFQTGVPPVDQKETIEIFAFMEGAQESKDAGGTVVQIGDVMKRHKPKTAKVAPRRIISAPKNS